MQPLALRYRPRRFSEVVGQLTARVVIQTALKSGKLPSSLLFYGSMGAGKTTMARLVAAALNCEHEDSAERPCGSCGTCNLTAEGRSADVTEIDAASNGRAEDMRALRERIHYIPQHRYKVVILDEVHALSGAAFDALLKTLEEPPPNVVFILVTTDKAKVKDTIVSRCLGCEFSRIADAEIAGRVQSISEAEGFCFTVELCAAIAARARGVARDAVMLAEQASLVGIRTPDQLAQLLGQEDHGVGVVAALVAGHSGGGPDYPTSFLRVAESLALLPSASDVVAALTSTLRRCLVLTMVSSGETLSPPPSAAERALAAQLDSGRCVAGLRVIWEYLTKIPSSMDPHASLDLVVTLLGQVLAGSGYDVSSRQKKLSSEQMVAMVR